MSIEADRSPVVASRRLRQPQQPPPPDLEADLEGLLADISDADPASEDDFPLATFEDIVWAAESRPYGAFLASIPPDVAGRLLERPLVRIRQRNIVSKRVDRYAQEMLAGRWAVRNGQGIVFAEGGDLFDGRHRLTAAARANFVLPTLMVVGADPTAFGTVDVGLHRTDSQILQIEGQENTSCLAAAVKVLWRIERDPTRYNDTATPTPSEIVQLTGRYPEIQESIRRTQSKQVRALLSPSVAAACHYLFSTRDPEAANAFFEQLHSGAGLAANDPVLRLRNKLTGLRKSRSGSSQAEYLALMIKAWNAMRAGRPVQVLAWRPEEAFPVVR